MKSKMASCLWAWYSRRGICVCSSLLLYAVHYCCVQSTTAVCIFIVFLFWCYTQFIFILLHPLWNLCLKCLVFMLVPILLSPALMEVQQSRSSVPVLSRQTHLSEERSRGLQCCPAFWVLRKAGNRLSLEHSLCLMWGLNYQWCTYEWSLFVS